MYVKRDDSKKITSVSMTPEKDVMEYVEDDDAELVAFMKANNLDAKKLLAYSDNQMARVMEDIVNLLVNRGVIQFIDLPAAAQEKLLSRRDARSKVKNLGLLDDDETVEL